MQLKKTTRFRQLLASPELEFLIEAHNGISARIGEEAGFRGIWAGGLCMSAQYGVRDSNEASWTQVLEMLEFMADATSIPILLDGDTGYGNFNNVRRLVRKLEQRGIAAVCIEDKLYPKTNSFIDGDKQQLADVDEFCSRIKAGKDAQTDDEFAIITRVEAVQEAAAEAIRALEAVTQRIRDMDQQVGGIATSIRGSSDGAAQDDGLVGLAEHLRSEVGRFIHQISGR